MHFKQGMLAATALIAAVAFSSGSSLAAGNDVLTYHKDNTRHGAYEVPDLTLAHARHVHLDTAFNATFSGNVYAQPLYYKPDGGTPLVIVATESNAVHAFNAVTGAAVWTAQLPAPVALNQLPCGNINPEGITGTPVIDPKTGTLYLDALLQTGSGPRQNVYALSLKDGSVLSGWPLDVQAALAAKGVTFTSLTQGQRSAALLFNGNLYVEYGGRSGDCGTYHGTVVQFTTSPAGIAGSWATRANGGGIWAQGGVAGDGQSVFATTGNTFGAQSWSDGEAIIRLKPGLAHSSSTKDFYTPANWATLDAEDADLGGTEALPLEVPRANSPAPRVIAFGKDGNAYLVNRSNLGGIGGAAAIAKVSNSAIITAPAIYNTSRDAMVAFTSFNTTGCSGTNVVMLQVTNTNTPIKQAWCASSGGAGSPIVTTTDGTSDPVVWVVGAEGDNLLHGFNAKTGEVVFDGGGSPMQGLRHFQTLIATDRRIYVAADNKVYAFTFGK